MNYSLIFWVFFFGVFQGASQEIEVYPLGKSLNEISGLEFINDSTLVAFNDGGNSAKLYLLNLKGEILKQIEVTNAKNKDWEDITSDGTYLYIGDIGNNANKRKHLRIYKLKIEAVLKKKEVKAEIISFNYGEQKAFPPAKDSLFYDAEGMSFFQDSIWIFTKNRAENSNGHSIVYKIPTEPNHYTVYKSDSVFIGTNGWLIDGVTAVDVFENQFYLLTYNRFLIYTYQNNEFVFSSEFLFEKVAQRESIKVLSKKEVFVADEKNIMTGNVQLYKITFK